MSTQAIVHEQLTVTPLHRQPRPANALISGTDNNGILRVSLPQPLEEGTVVRVAAAPYYSTTGRVLYSVPVNGSHYATIRTENNRREDVRIKVAEHANVTSMQRHIPIACDASVIDVSRTGIGFITTARMPRDLLVKITLDSAIIFGEVRHSERMPGNGDTFQVGVEIQTVIFRDADQPSNWKLAPKVLWASMSLRLQAFAARMRRSPVM